jgi:LacI family transcriptional regulator
MKLTIHDIAKSAGVSTGTVSRALNDRAGVNKETRERILEIVERMGYVPDVGARQLARGERTVIGITRYSDTSLRNPYYTLLVDAIQESLIGSGYNVHILGSDTELERSRFAGVIVPGVRLEDDRLAHLMLQRNRTPFVAIGIGFSDPKIASVELNNRSGMLEIMQHLISKGHQKIAHMTGTPIGRDAQQRLEAYREGLGRAGLEFERVIDGGFTELGAYRGMAVALRNGEGFTALTCASDEMALGAIQALKDAGRDVPGDIAVTGFDDLPLDSFRAAGLTTVHQPLAEIGHQAAQLLLEQLEGLMPRTVTFTPKLIVRQTA